MPCPVLAIASLRFSCLSSLHPPLLLSHPYPLPSLSSFLLLLFLVYPSSVFPSYRLHSSAHTLLCLCTPFFHSLILPLFCISSLRIPLPLLTLIAFYSSAPTPLFCTLFAHSFSAPNSLTPFSLHPIRLLLSVHPAFLLAPGKLAKLTSATALSRGPPQPTGVSIHPTFACLASATYVARPHISSPEFDNCRHLSEELQVEWQAHKEEVQVRLTAHMDENQYVAFGVSPVSERPEMLNSDLVVAYYDRDDGSFHAIDYSVTSRSQCDGTQGVCPDEKVNGRNDASVISGERNNGITTITFSRPYQTNDRLDLPISRYHGTITVVAAIGHLNPRKEAHFHEEFVTKDNVVLDFRAVGDNTCTPRVGVEKEAPRYTPWEPRILRAVTNFTATIGPTGGERGYSATTKKSFWKIAWWINGKLIPEIFVERGQTYYFKVFGGNDQLNTASYHPFYITDSPVGGFNEKTREEQEKEIIYAGVTFSKMGMPEATAVGSLCEWQHMGKDAWEISDTFEDYTLTLYLDCKDNKTPGSLVWTVDEDTPDLVYYQCYRHPNMGWKIHVVNNGYKSRREGGNGGSCLSSPHPLHLLLLHLLLLCVSSSLLLALR